MASNNASMNNRARIVDAISNTEDDELSVNRHEQYPIRDVSFYESEPEHNSERSRTPVIGNHNDEVVEDGRFRTCTRSLAAIWQKAPTTFIRLIIGLIGVILLSILIALAALLAESKKSAKTSKASSSGLIINTGTSASLVQDSSLTIAPTNFSSFFTPTSSVSLNDLLVYDAGNNTVCVKGRQSWSALADKRSMYLKSRYAGEFSSGNTRVDWGAVDLLDL